MGKDENALGLLAEAGIVVEVVLLIVEKLMPLPDPVLTSDDVEVVVRLPGLNTAGVEEDETEVPLPPPKLKEGAAIGD